MEKKFLLYLLYIVLIDIRERSLENGDSASYWLTNLLHNVPLAFDSDEDIKQAYEIVLERVEHDNMNKWLENRRQEFYASYPEFKTS